METENRPIGIFDSGVGGLTVLKRVQEDIPNEKIIYFADTKRAPYGLKDEKTITEHTRQIVRFLITHNIKLLVIACNTISAVSLSQLKKEFNIPIIEVTTPGSEDAAFVAPNNKIGVIATEATVRSGIYEKKLKAINPQVQVYSKPCTLFVTLVEEGWVDNQASYLIAKMYLEDMKNKDISTLILGCTHFPLLYNSIKQVVKEKIIIIDPAYATSKKTKEYLVKNKIINNSKNNINNYEFYVSSNNNRFDKLCKKFIGYRCKSIKVEIESY